MQQKLALNIHLCSFRFINNEENQIFLDAVKMHKIAVILLTESSSEWNATFILIDLSVTKHPLWMALLGIPWHLWRVDNDTLETSVRLTRRLLPGIFLRDSRPNPPTGIDSTAAEHFFFSIEEKLLLLVALSLICFLWWCQFFSICFHQKIM